MNQLLIAVSSSHGILISDSVTLVKRHVLHCCAELLQRKDVAWCRIPTARVRKDSPQAWLALSLAGHSLLLYLTHAGG